VTKLGRLCPSYGSDPQVRFPLYVVHMRRVMLCDTGSLLLHFGIMIVFKETSKR